MGEGTRLVIRGRNLAEEETSRRSASKVDVHVGGWCVLGHQNRNGVWLTRTILWRKNADDAKMDGERPKGEVVTMDNDYKEKLEMEEHVPVPRRVYMTREDLEVFGFTASCSGCTSWLGETSAHKNCRRRIEDELTDDGGSSNSNSNQQQQQQQHPCESQVLMRHMEMI